VTDDPPKLEAGYFIIRNDKQRTPPFSWPPPNRRGGFFFDPAALQPVQPDDMALLP